MKKRVYLSSILTGLMEQKNFELFDKFNKVLVWALGLFMFEKIL